MNLTSCYDHCQFLAAEIAPTDSRIIYHGASEPLIWLRERADGLEES